MMDKEDFIKSTHLLHEYSVIVQCLFSIMYDYIGDGNELKISYSINQRINDNHSSLKFGDKIYSIKAYSLHIVICYYIGDNLFYEEVDKYNIIKIFEIFHIATTFN